MNRCWSFVEGAFVLVCEITGANTPAITAWHTAKTFEPLISNSYVFSVSPTSSAQRLDY